jgi:hypothetical protein
MNNQDFIGFANHNFKRLYLGSAFYLVGQFTVIFFGRENPLDSSLRLVLTVVAISCALIFGVLFHGQIVNQRDLFKDMSSEMANTNMGRSLAKAPLTALLGLMATINLASIITILMFLYR